MSGGGYYSASTGDRINYMGGHNMVQDFGDEFDSTLMSDRGYQMKMGKEGNLSPGGHYDSKLSQIPEQSQVVLTEPVDYGRDYYMLLRKFHQERTACSNPTKEELFATFKILQGSLQASKDQRNRATYASEANSKLFNNPYDKGPKASQISVETQIRLAGSSFKANNDIAANKGLSTKHDLVVGKDPDSVRYTIKLHHDVVNQENDLFKKEEHFVLKRQREIKQKKLQEQMKKQRSEVRQKYAKSELYQ